MLRNQNDAKISEWGSKVNDTMGLTTQYPQRSGAVR